MKLAKPVYGRACDDSTRIQTIAENAIYSAKQKRAAFWFYQIVRLSFTSLTGVRLTNRSRNNNTSTMCYRLFPVWTIDVPSVKRRTLAYFKIFTIRFSIKPPSSINRF